MKKKNIESYFTGPQAKVLTKPKFEICPSCAKPIFYKLLPFHTCLPVLATKTSLPVPLSKPLQELMATSQTTLKSNFELIYLGHQDGRHKWSYSFTNSGTFTSKVHKLRLSKQDPQSILLTFSTSHQGNPLHFFDCIELPGFSAGVLKSLLQKSIRRCFRLNSIKTSIQFACNLG